MQPTTWHGLLSTHTRSSKTFRIGLNFSLLEPLTQISSIQRYLRASLFVNQNTNLDSRNNSFLTSSGFSGSRIFKFICLSEICKQHFNRSASNIISTYTRSSLHETFTHNNVYQGKQTCSLTISTRCLVGKNTKLPRVQPLTNNSRTHVRLHPSRKRRLKASPD